MTKKLMAGGIYTHIKGLSE